MKQIEDKFNQIYFLKIILILIYFFHHETYSPQWNSKITNLP